VQERARLHPRDQFAPHSHMSESYAINKADTQASANQILELWRRGGRARVPGRRCSREATGGAVLPLIPGRSRIQRLERSRVCRAH